MIILISIGIGVPIGFIIGWTLAWYLEYNYNYISKTKKCANQKVNEGEKGK